MNRFVHGIISQLHMCGIVGFAGQGGVQILQKMMLALAHRGPDGSDLRIDPPVYLGHRRLAILDLPGGRQPMTTADGRYAIVFNGEIYNHLELRRELSGLGYHFQTDHSDTEALLIGFAAWGLRVLEKLNGMWAFVLYDRIKRKLFAARDRFGKKPLYYWHRGTDFAFASELSALLPHPHCPRSISQLSLQKYFAYGYIPAPRSIIENVWKLPAGHSLVFNHASGELTVRRYWEYVAEPAELPAEAPAEALAEELQSALRRATQIRLQSDVPLGVFLSGGLDSSAVAALARPAVPELRTFTVGFKEPSFDESRYAQDVATGLRTKHATQMFSLDEAKAVLPRLVNRLDEPMGDTSLLPTFLLCRFAREHVTVALAGDGGDELFCGYDPFRALRRADLYAKLVPRPVHLAARLLASRIPVSHRNLSLDFKIKRTLRGLSFPARLWLPIWMGPLSPDELTDLFQQPLDPDELYSEAIDAWERCQTADLIGRTQQFFINLYLQDSILTKVDRASMLNGLEVRCPFLDRDVVDLVRRIPSHLKFHQGESKWILKKALEHIVPEFVLKRKKKGFGMPVGKWFLDGSILQLSEQQQTSARYRAEFFERKLVEHRAGVADHRLYLWSGWLLNQWLAR